MSRTSAAHKWFSVRLRLVGSAVLVGCLLSGTGIVFLSLVGTHFGSEEVFSLAALVFGFGLFGWSSAALSGRAIENAKRHLDISPSWTETKARRAMARIGGFGAGGMAGVMLTTLVLRILT